MELNSKKTVLKNTGILYIRMLITLIVSLYTSRVILEVLGIDDFGIYGVIGGIVGLFAFLSRTLTVSFNRFLCIGIAKRDIDEINHVFGASIVVQLIIIALVLILSETAGIWFINNYLVISPEKLAAAHVVFQFSIATFIVNIFTSSYNSIVISYERMSIYAYICIFEVIAKLAVVFALVLATEERLILYSGYIFGIQVMILAVYHLYVRKKFSGIHPVFENSRPYIKNMLSFTGYGFIGSFGFVVKNQGLNFLLNIFGGPVLNAARAISFQVYTAIYNFVGNFQTAFSPYILKRQTTNSEETCNSDVNIFTHVSFFVMVCLMIPVWFAAPQIISLWLGDNVPLYTVAFTRLILIIGLCEAISAPLQNIISGSGKIKWLQLIALITYISVIVVGYLLLKKGGDPEVAYYVDLGTNILMVGVRIIIANVTTDLRLNRYLYKTILPILLVITGLAMIYMFTVAYNDRVISGILLGECLLLVYIYFIIPKDIVKRIISKGFPCIKVSLRN